MSRHTLTPFNLKVSPYLVCIYKILCSNGLQQINEFILACPKYGVFDLVYFYSYSQIKPQIKHILSSIISIDIIPEWASSMVAQLNLYEMIVMTVSHKWMCMARLHHSIKCCSILSQFSLILCLLNLHNNTFIIVSVNTVTFTKKRNLAWCVLKH